LLDNRTLNFQISHRYKLEILYITGIEILPGFFKISHTGPRPEC
jgi:hypothetical protein